MKFNIIALAVKTLNPNTVRDIVFKLGSVKKKEHYNFFGGY